MGIDSTMLESGGSPASTRAANFMSFVSSDHGAIYRQLNLCLICSGTPAWKRLIDHPLTSDERISLIKDIFSDRNETEIVRHLVGDCAQSFVDVIDQVIPPLQ